MAKISMNTTATMHNNLIGSIKIAQEVGFEGIEIQVEKLFPYLDAGNSPESLLPYLEGMEVVAVGALQNIERQGNDYDSYIEDVKRVCIAANKLGSSLVQVCTGPSDVNTICDFKAGKIVPGDPRYLGLLGESEERLIDLTAKNVAAAADIAADYGIDLYIEPLAWVPLCKISQALDVIEAAGKKNVGVVIDFWHMWTTGETPEFVSSIDKDLIKIVHVCDGMEYDRTTTPVQSVLRDVWTGEGDIPLKKWIDAVKATGYDGWYSTEIFSERIHQQDQLKTAQTLKNIFEFMI